MQTAVRKATVYEWVAVREELARRHVAKILDEPHRH
jgi:hypothetical protein